MPVSLIPLVGGLAGMFFAHAVRLRDHQEGRHDLRDDHAGHRRTGVGDVADVPGVLRRRGRHHDATAWSASRSSGITFGPQIQVYYLIAVYTFVCTALMYAFTRTPLGPHAQRGARQPGARRVHRLQHAAGALPRLHHRRLLRRHRRRPGGAQLRDRRPPKSSSAVRSGALPAVHLPRRRDLLLRADHRRAC